MGEHLEWVRMEESCIDAVKEAMDEREALLRVVRAALGVSKDAFFSDEGGEHFLVDVNFIVELESSLEALPEHLRSE